MIVDAAAGGALMNKNYTSAYALIEDMAQNHYQWTNERAITASSPSKKEAGMYEVSPIDHLAAKVDALTQELNNFGLVEMLKPMRGFENFTCEFLSSISFTKDRSKTDKPNHRVSFCLLNFD
jgi:hypothetical protein